MTAEFEALLTWIKAEATDADLQHLREALADQAPQMLQIGKYNINIGQGQVDQIGDRTQIEINAAAIEAIVAAIQQRLPFLRPGVLDEEGVQRYLRSILDDENYRELQDVYTQTTVEGKKRSAQSKVASRLKLRVETVKPDRQLGQAEPEPDQREQVEQWEVLDGLRKYAADHVLLVGRPGSGKSTSLERLLWEEASKAVDQPDAQIPVLVELRRCTSTIEELIQDFLSRHRLPLESAEIDRLLNQGKLLLLLDGLNELPEQLGTKAVNFRDKYRRTTPMIVSTRDLSVGGSLGITKTLKMLPLTERQMQDFVRGYLREAGDRLFQQLKGDRLRKFAETPLLLWMLCWVFDRNGEVPANLGLAFREFTQLHDREIQADAPVESKDQWHRLLRHLAFALMQGEKPIDLRLSMPIEEAQDLLTECLKQEDRANPRDCAERWLKDLLKYHLIQPVVQPNFEEHIEFRHQLIQEYYAAEYLLQRLPNLSDEQLQRDYLNYLKWTESIALMLALVKEEAQAVRVVKLAMDVDLMLGARLVGEMQPAFQPKPVARITQLSLPPLLKIAILGTTRSESAIAELLQALEDQDSYVRGSAAEALGKVGGERAVPGLLQALEHQHSDVRWRAAEALGKVGSPIPIARLWQLYLMDRRLLEPIAAIQNRCQFYNYEIWQKAVSIQNKKSKMQNDGQGGVAQQVSGRTPEIPYYTVNAEVVQIIEQNHGNVIGKQSPDQK